MNNKNKVLNQSLAFILVIVFGTGYAYNQEPVMLVCQMIMIATVFIIGAMKS